MNDPTKKALNDNAKCFFYLLPILLQIFYRPDFCLIRKFKRLTKVNGRSLSQIINAESQ